MLVSLFTFPVRQPHFYFGGGGGGGGGVECGSLLIITTCLVPRCYKKISHTIHYIKGLHEVVHHYRRANGDGI
jgi:hypothetical protein